MHVCLQCSETATWSDDTKRKLAATMLRAAQGFQAYAGKADSLNEMAEEGFFACAAKTHEALMEWDPEGGFSRDR